jgi:hypothetical protein
MDARQADHEPEVQRDLATLRASQTGSKGEPANEIERQIDRALAEVRAEWAATRATLDDDAT